jgi:predicted transcriptional regulator
MTLTIEIAPEIESRLEAEAHRSGISKSDLAKNVIEQRFAPKEDKRKNYMPEGFTPRYIGKAETRDFSGDDEWLAENREQYIGKYVATHGNRLIASGNDFKEVAREARDKGFKDALIYQVEDPNAPPFVEFIS